MLAQFHSSETVRMSNICIVGEVEEIAIRSELEFGSAAVVSFHHAGKDDVVSHANDTGGADGAGVERWEFRDSVLGEDEVLRYGLVEMSVEWVSRNGAWLHALVCV